MLSGNRNEVRPQIGSLIGQAEFDAQVFAVKIDRSFANIQNIGYFLAGFAVFDQTGHLRFLGRQQNFGIDKSLQQGGYHIIQMRLNDLYEDLVFGFDPGTF